MKVDINKLTKYPSRSSEELGAIDFADYQDIDACIEEVMIIDEEARFEELPMDEATLEIKTLPSTLKYAFLDEEKDKSVIILSKLDIKQEEQLLEVLRRNEEAISWTLTKLKGLDPSLCTHRIFLEDESRPVRAAQRRLNPKVWEAVKEEILKWLKAKIIYPISNSQWVSLMHVVLKKAGVTVITSEKGKEIQTGLLTKWRVYIDLSKAELCNEEGPLPATVHRPNPGPTSKISLLLLSGRIFSLQLDCDSFRRSREDDVHMSFWHIGLQTHAIWTVQCPRNLSILHDGNLLRLSWRQLGGFHGRL